MEKTMEVVRETLMSLLHCMDIEDIQTDLQEAFECTLPTQLFIDIKDEVDDDMITLTSYLDGNLTMYLMEELVEKFLEFHYELEDIAAKYHNDIKYPPTPIENID